jgi:peptidyl-prolyl cis-trans isomerase D
MLQNMRAHAQGWIAWLIAGVLCLAFALWGVEYYIGGNQKNLSAATVNGEEISNSQWDASYSRLQQTHPLGQQANFNPALEQQLRSQALNQLVEQTILAQAATGAGYVFSMQQVTAIVMSFPEFQVNGQFSKALFTRITQQLFKSEEAFLKDVQNSSLIIQAKTGIMSTTFALPGEVDRLLAGIHEKRSIQYINIPTAQFVEAAQVSNDDITQYYQTHQSDFMTKEAISLQYIMLSPDNAEEKVSVSEQEIAAYYQDNKDEFPNAATEKLSDANHATIEKTLKQQKVSQLLATQSEQLANLTYTNSDTLEPAANELGLKIETTPFFQREGTGALPFLTNPKILAIAFSDNVLTERNNSDVISLDDTHAIVVRVADYKPSAPRPLEEVRAEIENKLKNQVASNIARAQAEKIVASINAKIPLEEVARTNHVTWQTASDFTRENHSGLSDEIVERSFSLPAPEEDKRSAGIIAPSNGDAFVIVLNKITPTDIKAVGTKEREAAKQKMMDGMSELEYSLYVSHYISQAKVKNPK